MFPDVVKPIFSRDSGGLVSPPLVSSAAVKKTRENAPGDRFKFDVTVVGAGPAGSSAARELALRGIKVALLERAKFPRDKICGDICGPRTLKLLSDIGVLGAFGNLPKVNKASAFTEEGKIFEGVMPAFDGFFPYAHVIPRKLLDHELAQLAVKDGASLFESCEADGMEYNGGMPSGVSAHMNGKDVLFESRIVIAADGAYSPVGRSAGLHPNKPKKNCTTVRAYFRNIRKMDPSCASFFYDERYFPGYGWAFPMEGGMANVGIGMRSDIVISKHLSLRNVFLQFIKTNKSLKDMLEGAEMIESPRGWYIPCYGQAEKPYSDGILLAGDAASFVDSLSGEGVSHALESGSLAARVAAEALKAGDFSAKKLSVYHKLVKDAFGDELWWSAFFQAIPGLKHGIESTKMRALKDEKFLTMMTGMAIGAVSKKKMFSFDYFLKTMVPYWGYLIKNKFRMSNVE